jgi:hypothetical protein
MGGAASRKADGQNQYRAEVGQHPGFPDPVSQRSLCLGAAPAFTGPAAPVVIGLTINSNILANAAGLPGHSLHI